MAIQQPLPPVPVYGEACAIQPGYHLVPEAPLPAATHYTDRPHTVDSPAPAAAAREADVHRQATEGLPLMTYEAALPTQFGPRQAPES